MTVPNTDAVLVACPSHGVKLFKPLCCAVWGLCCSPTCFSQACCLWRLPRGRGSAISTCSQRRDSVQVLEANPCFARATVQWTTPSHEKQCCPLDPGCTSSNQAACGSSSEIIRPAVHCAAETCPPCQPRLPGLLCLYLPLPLSVWHICLKQ